MNHDPEKVGSAMAFDPDVRPEKRAVDREVAIPRRRNNKRRPQPAQQCASAVHLSNRIHTRCQPAVPQRAAANNFARKAISEPICWSTFKVAGAKGERQNPARKEVTSLPRVRIYH
jgi:hypothetical protein